MDGWIDERMDEWQFKFMGAKIIHHPSVPFWVGIRSMCQAISAVLRGC